MGPPSLPLVCLAALAGAGLICRPTSTAAARRSGPPAPVPAGTWGQARRGRRCRRTAGWPRPWACAGSPAAAACRWRPPGATAPPQSRWPSGAPLAWAGAASAAAACCSGRPGTGRCACRRDQGGRGMWVIAHGIQALSAPLSFPLLLNEFPDGHQQAAAGRKGFVALETVRRIMKSRSGGWPASPTGQPAISSPEAFHVRLVGARLHRRLALQAVRPVAGRINSSPRLITASPRLANSSETQNCPELWSREPAGPAPLTCARWGGSAGGRAKSCLRVPNWCSIERGCPQGARLSLKENTRGREEVGWATLAPSVLQTLQRLLREQGFLECWCKVQASRDERLSRRQGPFPPFFKRNGRATLDREGGAPRSSPSSLCCPTTSFLWVEGGEEGPRPGWKREEMAPCAMPSLAAAFERQCASSSVRIYCSINNSQVKS